MQQKQILRLIAMAMADDNTVGRREFDMVCEIIHEQWSNENQPSLKEIAQIVRDLQKTLLEPSVRQSIFMNVDALSNHDIEVEVRNLMRIIVADNSITDREREAFIIYCHMMRVKNTSQLWRELSKMTLKELRDLNIHGPKVIFRKQKSRMKLPDFEMIYDAFTFYKIQSPILDGAHHILNREKTRNLAFIIRQNKLFNKAAFRLFIICALCIIYPLVSVPATHPLLVQYEELCGSVISVCILIMMLAIEWLIFMRSNSQACEESVIISNDTKPYEEASKFTNQHSKHHTSLTLFVVIAILLDTCLGIIEIPAAEIGIYTVLIKILSAMLLGCICFFTGKFFENHREQQVNDINKMGYILDRLHSLIISPLSNKS